MFYAAMAVLSFLVQAVSNKEFARRFPGDMAGMMAYNTIMLLITALICGAICGFQPPTPATLMVGVPFGALFVVTILLCLLAMAKGPMGPSVLLLNMSMLITIVFGLLQWGEGLNAMKGAGIACVLAVLTLSAFSGGKGGRKGSLPWLLIALGALVLNGVLSVLQKTMTLMEPETGALVFGFWAFLSGSLVSFILLIVRTIVKRERVRDWFKAPRELLACALGCGASTAGGNVMLMTAMIYVPVVILSPLVQGSIIMLVWVVSVVFYREKVTWNGLAMIALGMLGVALLGMA